MKISLISPISPLRDRGFALVVTLMLMILLTVIAVGLLTISSIALRSSASSSAMAEARQNARLAMMLAIGELQKYSGPDQRVTATADIAAAANGNAVAAGTAPLNNQSINGVPKGLSAVQLGTRYWTGVWRNSNLTTPGTEIYTKTPSPTLLQWLVSGNESLTGSNSLTPAATSCALAASGKVSDSKTAVVLVGANSVGSAATNLTRFVSVPMVNLSTSKSNGPASTSGRYAWWIGDEGVKAPINLKADYGNNATATYPSLSGQRRGWESVAGFQNYPLPGNDSNLPKAITTAQAALLDASFSQPAGDSPLQHSFHSATADSHGVLADVLQGSLRLDLTSCLNTGNAATSDLPNRFNPANNIIPKKSASGIDIAPKLIGPKWQQLKDFHDFSAGAASSKVVNAGTLIGGSGASATQGSGISSSGQSLPAAGLAPGAAVISPLIVDLRVILGAQWEAIPASPGSYSYRPCVKISVVLANPYPYPLNWNDLDLEFIDETPPGNDPSQIYVIYNEGGFHQLPTSPPYLNKSNTSSVLGSTLFQIGSSSLPPGASRAYTVGAKVDVTLSRKVPMVEMTPASDPQNFEICVMGSLNPSIYPFSANSNYSLDVRESAVTSTPSVELRLAGSSPGANVLRRIERLEWDNGFFTPTQRHFGDHDAPTNPPLFNVATWKKPFGLQLYGYQLSLPGADYSAYLPASSQGGRGSAIRTYADFNLQALRFGKPIACYSPPPYFLVTRDSYSTFGITSGLVGECFQNMPAPRWPRAAVQGSETGVLFGFPSHFVSLAQFQHADLTANDYFFSISQQPGNALGNSYAPPFVTRDLSTQQRTDYALTGVYLKNQSSTVSGVAQTYYDISYLLNASLWDTYFLSTLPNSGSKPLNSSIELINPQDASADLMDPAKAAAHLLVNGAFNVNSTEKDAWKALLSSTRFLKHPNDDGSADTSNGMFPRSLEQITPAKVPATGNDADSFSGFRRLTPDQIDALATEITRQVRMRGPFVSLSQFVNRSLVTLKNDSDGLGRSGALQSAIDQCAKINISTPGGSTPSAFSSLTQVNPTQDKVIIPVNGSRNEADLAGGANGAAKPDDPLVWPNKSRDMNMGTAGSIYADRDTAKGDILSSAYSKELGYRSTGIPGWLTQADVLQVIGPSISARSDTFRIRCCGESIDPVTKIAIARAYCEAVVQRMPYYIDPSDPPQIAADKLTSAVNKQFGRKYNLASFRWLDSNEI